MAGTVRWSLKVSRSKGLSRFGQDAVQAKLSAARGAGRKSGTQVRTGLAEALAEIRASTRALPKARFEKLVAEAVAYARKRR